MTRTAPAPQTLPPPAPPDRSNASALGSRGRLILLTLCAAQFMVALDFSIVTVALTDVGMDLGIRSASTLQWVMTAFVLPVGSMLLLFSRVADRVGRRPVLLAGLVLVCGFSVLAAMSSVSWLLFVARAGQGVGSAMVGPTALALLTSSFKEGPERDRALGVNGAMLSLGFIVGTIGGGVLTAVASWRWTMVVLAVMSGVILLLALSVVSDARAVRRSGTMDVAGGLLVTLSLFALVYALATGQSVGWGSASTIGAFVAAAVLLSALVIVENRVSDPLIPLPFLAQRRIWCGMLAGATTFGMAGGATVLLSLYMEQVLGWTSLQTGLGLLGEGVAAIAIGAVAARIVATGRTRALRIGLGVQAVCTIAMWALGTTPNVLLLVLTSAGMGLGHVLSIVAFIGWMTSGLADDRQGVAGGLAQTAQQIGAAVGLAVLTLVVTVIGGGNPSRSSLLDGLHIAFVTAAALILVVIVVVSIVVRGKRTVTRVAE